MVLDDWQRIEKIVRWTGLSVNSFALNIGLNRSETIYQIKRGNHGISKELAELISTKYPEISKAWVITGEGEMFLGGSGERSIIPVYEMDAVCLARMEKLPTPSFTASLPHAGKAAFAALILNRAMEPDIPNGSLIVLAHVSSEEIIPGYPYLIVSDRVAAVRNVFFDREGGLLRLAAANPAFGDITLDLDEVKRIYAVRAHIHYNI